MQLKKLGNSGALVSPIAFGGNVFGWTIGEKQSFEILDAFVDRGYNFVDTADVYSVWVPGNKGGESETTLGKWFAHSGKRDKVFLATKVGFAMPGGKGLSKEWIAHEVEASLKRLQTDYIDLYQSHTDDETVPLEETLGAYDALVKAGKVRLIGASNYKGARLAEAIETAKQHGLPVYQTLQPNYNLHTREEYERNLEPVAEKYGLGVINYFSLANGFLTGKYKTKADAAGTKRESRVAPYFDERGERILKALAAVEKEIGAKQASSALAWLLTRPSITAPIVSATNLAQLEDIFAAAELKLTYAQVQTLTNASAY